VVSLGCIGQEAKRVVEALQPGRLLFSKPPLPRGEEANSSDFAVPLAELGDVYIDDPSRGNICHASIAALAGLFPAAAAN